MLSLSYHIVNGSPIPAVILSELPRLPPLCPRHHRVRYPLAPRLIIDYLRPYIPILITMSKRSLFWGNGSGKLGEAVYYRAGGEQRTRTYVPVIKNPKSYAQAVVRTKFNNMVSVYKACRRVIDSLFIAKKSNQNPYNAWMQENARRNNWVADSELLGFSEGVSDGFLMANGQLAVPTTVAAMQFPDSINKVSEPVQVYYAAVDLPDFNIDATTVSFVAAPSTEQPLNIAINVGSQFYQMLVGELNPYNLPSEFYVTFITTEQGNAAPLYRAFSVRCAADSTDVLRQIIVPRGTDVIKSPSCIVLGSNAEIEAEGTLPTTAEGATAIALPGTGDFASAPEVSVGGAMFVAFRQDGVLNVTRSFMFYGQALQELVSAYTPEGEAGQSIIADYMRPSNDIVQ